MEISSNKDSHPGQYFALDLKQFTVQAGRLSGSLVNLPAGRYGFHLLLDSSSYPLAQHCCYMRSRPELNPIATPRCYHDMEFHSTPPGILVGPWPGWRGIPEMPPIHLRIAERSYPGRYNFWGDEFQAGLCRVFFLADLHGEETFVISWSNERLRPFTLTLYPSAKGRAQPVAVELNRHLAHVHPRLLFTAEDIVDFQRRRNASHAALWREIKKLLSRWASAFCVSSASKLPDGEESLHDMDRVILSAFSALLQPDQSNVERARNALTEFLTVASAPNYEPMLIDTQSGECLFTLCLGYDWLYPWLTTEDHVCIKEQLFKLAERVWQHLGYEREDYSQAHFLGCSHGLLAFALLFWQEHPRSREWVEYLAGVFTLVVRQLPWDGFYGHGINLWIYEHIFFMRYLELFRHGCSLDFWSATPYWRGASRFRAASQSPCQRLGITFGDPQYRVGGDSWIHALIARRTGCGQAQRLANRLASIPVAGVDFRNAPARRRVWEFLYHDPHETEMEPQAALTAFTDGGQFFWRSECPGAETLITFRAGSPLGKQRYDHGEWSGYGHSDPCSGSFLLVRHHSFLICGPGPVYRRDTALHNTMTFDGYGQIGDGLPWAPEFIPQDRFSRILKAQQDDGAHFVEAELAPAYLDFLAVRSLNRRLFMITADLILVHDRIELAKAREMQWNLHTYADVKADTSEGYPTLYISDGHEKLRLICLLPQPISWRIGWSEFVPAYPHSGERDRFIQFYRQGSALEFCFLLVHGDPPLDAALHAVDGRWQLDWMADGTEGHLLF